MKVYFRGFVRCMCLDYGDVLRKTSNKTSGYVHWGSRCIEQGNSDETSNRLENPTGFAYG